LLKLFVIITIIYRVQSKMAASQDVDMDVPGTTWMCQDVVTVRPKKVRFLLDGEKEQKEEEEEKKKMENVEKKFQILSLRPKKCQVYYTKGT